MIITSVHECFIHLTSNHSASTWSQHQYMSVSFTSLLTTPSVHESQTSVHECFFHLTSNHSVSTWSQHQYMSVSFTLLSSHSVSTWSQHQYMSVFLSPSKPLHQYMITNISTWVFSFALLLTTTSVHGLLHQYTSVFSQLLLVILCIVLKLHACVSQYNKGAVGVLSKDTFFFSTSQPYIQRCVVGQGVYM